MFRSPGIRLASKFYHPPSGTLLWLPARDIAIGKSPNLISWNGSAPSTGWTASKATLSEVTTPTPPVSAKALKVLCNDPGGLGTSYATQVLSNYANYKGVTLTLSAYEQVPNTNLLSQEYQIADGGGTNQTSVFAKDNAWHLVTVSRKISISASTLVPILYSKVESTANTTDILYVDNPVLTVPQSLDRSTYARILHPDAPHLTPYGWLFDGVDDLITAESDFIGTSALTIMGWIKAAGWGGIGTGQIVSNVIFAVSVYNTNSSIRSTSDGGVHLVESAASSISLNRWIHVTMTRTAAGINNFYINGQLSGTADQNSGTPAGGTASVAVGNSIAGDRAFNGWIDELVICNSVLPLSEIQRHYSMTYRGG